MSDLIETAKEEETALPPFLKLATEIGPLAVFFFANSQYDIFTATGAFMVAISAALIVSWVKMRKLPVMPMVVGAFVLVFGGLTLWLQDDTFIKLKPTIVNLLFAGILTAGLLLKRSFIKIVLEAALPPLSEAGWKQLTIRWALFFVLLAGLNEVIWRNFTTDVWVNFKVFGILPLTIAFTLLQLPLMKRHAIKLESAKD